jgi:hypothetical protein
VSASNFALNSGKILHKLFEMLEVPFGEETGRTQVFEWFSMCRRV